ncbi:hypothetical protein CK203_107542 [Vitis vinifera]|uniref:Uncharacterized protein n=1 Tax=Vitis vinifera TaxID=29760 RepID=A0A438CWW1_VITVI|nr:hypothetical protein CK203_107542 [Vitis vinifera]
MDAWRGVERENVVMEREKCGEKENEKLGIEGERWTGEEWVGIQTWRVYMGMRVVMCMGKYGGLKGWVCVDECNHGGGHACMIPMHVGGWLWDSYGDEHGMVREMRQRSGYKEVMCGVYKGGGLGKISTSYAAGWNYMNAVLKIIA